ncbi:hypothetical protein SAMN02745181_0525 [Rubritalea squalenifaciens DSM 18772]|uniref:Uncharacterized protein n=2 Tax=Rubritalea squalenifaciens TaxID=407226 RepID=A0A1M6CND5_9BACT|nr:hypothetical protein SAMN02745181_0525 [Rubritalea squalenifaciens DSM 18772]
MAVIAKVIYISNNTDVEIAAGVDPGFLKSEMGVFYADKSLITDGSIHWSDKVNPFKMQKRTISVFVDGEATHVLVVTENGDAQSKRMVIYKKAGNSEWEVVAAPMEHS